MSTPSATSLTSAPPEQAPTRRLAGWLSAGMLDWPGRVAATLFLSGCQMRCPYCHNPSLIEPLTDSSDETWRHVLEYVEHRRAWVDGFVITGGEPTTDPSLMSLLERLRAADIPVKLDTNGLRPDVLQEIVKNGLVSYIALDVKTDPLDYQRLTDIPNAGDRIAESISFVLDSGINHEFRTTCYAGVVELEELVTIARMLTGGDLYALQQFRADTTLSPEAKTYEPFSPMSLLEASHACSAYLPTITRGV